jgi:hypothetical protein
MSVVSGNSSKRPGDKDGSGSVVSSRSASSVTAEQKKRPFSSISSKPSTEKQPVVGKTDAVFLSPQSLLDHSHDDNNHLEDLLLHVGITPDRSVTKKTAAHKDHQQQRSLSAPKPRPSPLTFALSTEETKQAAKQDMTLLKTPFCKKEETTDDINFHPALATPSPATKPIKPLSSASASASAKKSLQSQTSSGFTAEQLSAYKARKRAAMSSGTSTNVKSPANVARYAAPTVSAYIRGKEKDQQSSGKKPSLIPVSVKGKDPNMITRNVSPSRRVVPPAIDEEKEENTKIGKKDDQSVGGNPQRSGRNPVIIDQTTHLRPSSPVKLSRTSMMNSNFSNNKGDLFSHFDRGSNEEKRESADSFTSLFSKRNSEGSSEGYNESMNILNMTIEDSTFSSPKAELKVLFAFFPCLAFSFRRSFCSNKRALKLMLVLLLEIIKLIIILLMKSPIKNPLMVRNLLLFYCFRNFLSVFSLLVSIPPEDLKSEMNRILEESKNLMEENKRVLQLVQERTASSSSASSASVGMKPINVLDISVIERTSNASPQIYSLGSAPSTFSFGESSTVRRPTFSPVVETNKKSRGCASDDSNNSSNASSTSSLPPPPPPSVVLPTIFPPSSSSSAPSLSSQGIMEAGGFIARIKRSISNESSSVTPRFGNISMISRSDSTHLLPPTPREHTVATTAGSRFSFSTSVPAPLPLGRSSSNSSSSSLTAVNNNWASEYLEMLNQPNNILFSAPLVSFPQEQDNNGNCNQSEEDQGGNDSSLQLPSLLDMERKLSITDSEVATINNPRNLLSTTPSIDYSNVNDSSNPLNMGMMRSEIASSLGLYSAPPSVTPGNITCTTGLPSLSTIAAVDQTFSPFTLTGTSTFDHSTSVVMMNLPSLMNPISMMDIDSSTSPPFQQQQISQSRLQEENKENVSPLPILSTRRSPFFDEKERRTPLQMIDKELYLQDSGRIGHEESSSGVIVEYEEMEHLSSSEDKENAAPPSILPSFSSVQNGTSYQLNEGFINSTTNSHFDSTSDSQLPFLSSTMASSPVKEDQSNEMMMNNISDKSIEKPHDQDSEQQRKMELSKEEEEEDQQRPPCFLPKQLTSSFELEPRTHLNVLPMSASKPMHPGSSSSGVGGFLPHHHHHVKALDYESIEKTPLTSSGKSTSSFRRSTASSINMMDLPTMEPSIPIPPVHERVMMDADEPQQQQQQQCMSLNRFLKDDDDDFERKEEIEQNQEDEIEQQRSFREDVDEVLHSCDDDEEELDDEEDEDRGTSIIELNEESIHSLTADNNIFLTSTKSLEGDFLLPFLKERKQFSELIEDLREADDKLHNKEGVIRSSSSSSAAGLPTMNRKPDKKLSHASLDSQSSSISFSTFPTTHSKHVEMSINLEGLFALLFFLLFFLLYCFFPSLF